jgi:hypothetical protein
MQSSTPTISVLSVELLVLSFCFVELTMGNPLPMDKPPSPPVPPLMFACAANDATLHHFNMPLPLALRISGNILVPLTCFIMFHHVDQLGPIVLIWLPCSSCEEGDCGAFSTGLMGAVSSFVAIVLSVLLCSMTFAPTTA